VSTIREEIASLESRKRILSVMLMEALKSGRPSAALFRCAELAIQRESKGYARRRGRSSAATWCTSSSPAFCRWWLSWR